MRYSSGLIFMLILVNIFMSLFIIYEASTDNYYCLTGGGCRDVQNSEYGTIFGLELSKFGLISFSALLVIYYLDYNRKIDKRIFLSFAIIGGLFASYFAYIQFFILNQICSNCLIVDSASIAIALTAIFEYKKGY